MTTPSKNLSVWLGVKSPADETQIRHRIAVASRLLEGGVIATPALLVDRSHLRGNVARWQTHLPKVDAYYAVKANVDPLVLRELFTAGARADVASSYEIEITRAMGLGGDRMILSNPRKDRDTVLAMKAVRCSGTMVDSEEEIDKLTAEGIPGDGYSPTLFVRIKVPLKGAQIERSSRDLSSKFGIRVLPQEAPAFGGQTPPLVINELGKLLNHARKAGFTRFGLAFHVGTQCIDAEIYEVGLSVAHRAADALRREGFNVTTIDMGGGYPDGRLLAAAEYGGLLAALGRAAAKVIEAGYQVIAEPGRSFVADAGFLVTRVTYDRSTDITGRRVQIDDGVYRTLSARVHDERDYIYHAFRLEGAAFMGMFSDCAVWGCSCDSFDKVSDSARLPADLQIGDYLIVDCVGAYSTSFGSNTNGFQPATVVAYEAGASEIATEASPIADVNALMLSQVRHWLRSTVVRTNA